MDSSIKLKSKVENWKILSQFIESFLQKCGCVKNFIYEFLLSCEEIFVNICFYAYKSAEGEISVDICMINDHIKIVFSDSGAKFDPTKFENKNINSKIYNRKPGGLGIFLAKKTMDEMKYTRKCDKNILVMTKKIGR